MEVLEKKGVAGRCSTYTGNRSQIVEVGVVTVAIFP